MNKKLIMLKKNFLHITFWRYPVHLHHFSKIKSQKESDNSRNQDFSYYFCMMIEGSGSGAESGSIPLTSGSGSRRPKNQCCGSGYGIRCLFDPWIRDPGIRNRCFPDPGSQTHTFESLVTIFWAKSSIILWKLAQIFFLQHFKTKIMYNFVKFMAT